MPDQSDSVNYSSLPLSNFGKQLGVSTGIGELMDDLGAALSNRSQDLCMLGGGQPAEVPEMVDLFQQRLQDLARDRESVQSVLGEYDPAGGSLAFRQAVAEMMNSLHGWGLSSEHIGLASGGQSACFHLMNAFAGQGEHVMLPLLPDYMGYRDQLVSGAEFYGVSGIIERRGDTFKYVLDRDAVQTAPDTVRLVALSRPTNPSGNIMTDAEISFLSRECKERAIPLLIDHAYGAPFPAAEYVQASAIWEEHHIHLYSLSKLGLPGCRTAIVIARPEIIRLLCNMTAVTSLANPNLGQALILPLIQDQTLPRMCSQVLTPFYRAKRDHAVAYLRECLGSSLDYALHAPEGAFFLWLWLPQLEMSSLELVERLKHQGVLAISGHWFFFGTKRTEAHHQQCLRITYCMSQEVVERGLRKLAKVVA